MDLDKVKALLGISPEDTSQDVSLLFVMADVVETITNYCNLKVLPQGLLNTACRMVTDLYRHDRPGSQSAPVNVASITEGKTSTSFTDASTALKGGVLSDYRAQLNRYRRLSK